MLQVVKCEFSLLNADILTNDLQSRYKSKAKSIDSSTLQNRESCYNVTLLVNSVRFLGNRELIFETDTK